MNHLRRDGSVSVRECDDFEIAKDWADYVVRNGHTDAAEVFDPNDNAVYVAGMVE